jgi:hypothetical protein
MKCPSCGSRNVDVSIGSNICSGCGLVLEESLLQVDVAFEQQKPVGQFISHLKGTVYSGTLASINRVSHVYAFPYHFPGDSLIFRYLLGPKSINYVKSFMLSRW